MTATRPQDLAARIARLEGMLDALEAARNAAAREGATPAPGAEAWSVDRLREAAGVLQQRATERACDQGDAIAMRVLLEEHRSLTAAFRAGATEVESRLNAIGSALADIDGRLNSLRDSV